MASESKILTVSYGTFSCTLEGFDDPFNAMKAVAEYFRDLAAQDRYFGAEPPQPDAAMLHRIAEREVNRLVESKVRDNSVVLRPQDVAAPSPRVSTGPRPDASQEGAATAQPTVEPALHGLIPPGVTAKLAQIRRSVNPSTFAPGYVPGAPEPEAPVAEAPAAASEAPEIVERAVTPIVAEAAAFEQTTPDAALADDAPADVLSRIGALVTDPEPIDVWHLDEPSVSIEAEVEPAADAAPMVELDDVTAEVEADVESWLANHAEASIPEAPAAETVAVEPLPPEAADLLPEAEEPPMTLADALLQDPLPETAPDAPQSLSEAQLADPLPEAVADSAEPEPEPEPAPLAEAAPAKTKAKRVNSRVVRIHPDDDAPAPRDPNATRILDGGDEDFARLLRQADDVMSDSENRRRLDSIAHLKAAVAATEADRAAGTEAKPTPRDDRYREDLAQSAPDSASGPEPEAKPRDKTISQEPRPGVVSPPPLVLVSEQRIDRVAPPAPAPAPEAKPMVALRTGRLTGAIGVGAAGASPVAPAQKLVLEQRSGAAETEDDDDQIDDLTPETEAGIARFADQMGAKSLVDLLEAAAAYATCIENRPQFTRPQLMRRMMATSGGKQVSREEGLRSFGTLLRTGRIEKVSRGHYILADHSPYLAEARRMA